MCTLKKSAVKEIPELAVYSVVFDSSREGSFTRSSVNMELKERGIDGITESMINRCFRSWCEHETIYKCHDGYRVVQR